MVRWPRCRGVKDRVISVYLCPRGCEGGLVVRLCGVAGLWGCHIRTTFERLMLQPRHFTNRLPRNCYPAQPESPDVTDTLWPGRLG